MKLTFVEVRHRCGKLLMERMQADGVKGNGVSRIVCRCGARVYVRDSDLAIVREDRGRAKKPTHERSLSLSV